MLKKVFMYSEEEAIKSQNYISLSKMLLREFIILILASFFPFICLEIFPDFKENIFFIILISFITLGMCLIYPILYRQKYSLKLTGLALDNRGIYFIKKQVKETYKHHIDLSALETSVNLMQDSENIIQMINDVQELSDVIVIEFLKIYEYKENLHKIKIKCDYKILKTGKIKYHKNINIYKCYPDFNELLKNLLNKN